MIPEEWSIKTLTDITTQIIDGTHFTPRYTTAGIPFLRVTDIQQSDIDFSSLKFISKAEHELLRKRCAPEKGDLLLSKNGTIGIPKVVSWDWDFSIFVSLALLKLRHQIISASFLEQFFKSEFLERQIRQRSKQGTVLNLHLEEIREFHIPLPANKVEQDKIATALSDVDALLGALDRLIAKKRDLKQAAMQQLLTGKTRLPGFEGEWDVKKFSQLGSTYGGLTGKSKNDFDGGNAYYITFTNVITNTVIDCSKFEKVNISSTELQNRTKMGDLLFNGSSETPEEVALCGVLQEEVSEVYLNSFCFGFRFREGFEADGLFFAYFFRSIEGREIIKSLAQGSTRYNLSKTAFLKTQFRLPSFHEQKAIADVLSDMDAELTALTQRRDKTQVLKQGMMQELLTGRTRLL